MKFVLCSLLMLPILASASSQSEEFYQAVKYMIGNSTSIRLQAFSKGDLTTVCRATPSSVAHDTMTYYISFEVFDEPNIKARLYKDLSPFVARNYESMYRSGLPLALHQACWSKSSAKIKQVMTQILGISSQESVMRK